MCLTTAPPLPTCGGHRPHSKTPTPYTHTLSAQTQAGLGQGGGQRKMTGQTAASVFLHPSTSTLSAFREIFTLLKTAVMSETGKKFPQQTRHTRPQTSCREKRLWPTSETTDWKVVVVPSDCSKISGQQRSRGEFPAHSKCEGSAWR